jgi:superfamily II DNA or RNA helicase
VTRQRTPSPAASIQPRYPLWPHQQDAVTATLNAIADSGRATVVAACGTGKTFIAADVSRHVAPNGIVAVFVPTIELLAQSAREWVDYLGGGAGDIVAVCSDEQSTYGAETVRSDLEQVASHVTTDPDMLRGHYRNAVAAGQRLTIFATYASLHVVTSALSRTRGVDLAVIDEAHRTAGAVGRPWAYIHHDAHLPARRRLYITATPRIGDADEELVSMDDTSVFGPVVYRLPFHTAIDSGLLADYRVVVGVVDPSRVFTGSFTETPEDGGRLRAAQIAVLRSVRDHGLRRVVTFHSRVAGARWFATTMPDAVRLLPESELPERPVHAAWISADTPVRERREIISRLRDPGDSVEIVANARIFGEGMDIPALDAVAFVDPRGSSIDVAQAVGRALRSGGQPGKIATIIVPVLLPDGDDQALWQQMNSPAWRPVWRVLRAIRAHDDRLDDRLAAARAPDVKRNENTGGILTVSGDIPAGLADAIRLRVLDAAASEWHTSYLRIAAFHAEHGHLRAPSGSFESFWLAEQRRIYRAGMLPEDRVLRLNELGMLWAPREESWAYRVAEARRFKDEFGHLSPPRDHPLGRFLSEVRYQRRAGRLLDERVCELDDLGIVWEPRDTWEASFTEGLAAAGRFHAAHGHLRVPAGYEDPEYQGNLHRWVAYWRSRWVEGKVPEDRRQPLAEVGMDVRASMSAKEAHWWDVYDTITGLWKATGSLVFQTGSSESKWLVHQRKLRREGRLSERQITALNAIGMVWEPRRR